MRQAASPQFRGAGDDPNFGNLQMFFLLVMIDRRMMIFLLKR